MKEESISGIFPCISSNF